MGEVACGGEHHREGGQCSGQRDHHLQCNGRLDGQYDSDKTSRKQRFPTLMCPKMLKKVLGNLWCSGQRDHYLQCNGRFDGQDDSDKTRH